MERIVGSDGPSALGEILEQTSEYLLWLKEEGVGHVEVARRLQNVKPGPSDAGRVSTRAPSAAVPLNQSAVPSSAVAPSSAMAAESMVAPVKSQTSELAAIAADIAGCKQCVLHRTRTRTVPGQGNLAPEILFIGEAPGADEDEQGLAFVGAAGQLLTRMILAMGLQREDVFIANILKCRPPGNRVPTPEEMETCMPYLKRQIECLKPKVIVALGATAVRGLLHTETGITKLRGNWKVFQDIPVMPTFHPAYLLRNPPAKKEAWEDLQAVLRRIGRTPPPVKSAKAG